MKRRMIFAEDSEPADDIKTSQIIQHVHRENSNLDMEFTDIEEGNDTDEVSPLPSRKKDNPGFDSRRFTEFYDDEGKKR